jgi:diaminopimelate epimerase
LISGRIQDGLPEIELQPVTDVRTDIDIPLLEGELRVGFAVAGIPHLVLLCENADAVDVVGRGPGLRHHPAAGPAGANVNWVSPRQDGTWRYRTFERGVEGETLACGTGAVATAILLSAWERASSPVTIHTSSGRTLDVRFPRQDGPPPVWTPSIRGEGRVVFRGQIESLHVPT